MVGISIGVSVDMVLYRQFANKPTCGQSGMKTGQLVDCMICSPVNLTKCRLKYQINSLQHIQNAVLELLSRLQNSNTSLLF